jgi:probable rRNA maturation factor
VVLTGLDQASGFGPGAELHVILVGGRAIARLNRTFLGHVGRTDVLAFALGTPSAPAKAAAGGDVYVCLPVAAEAAARYHTSIAHECVLYAVHGMLHLAGHDDGDAAGRQAMRRAERRVLRRLREKVRFSAIFGESVASPQAGV